MPGACTSVFRTRTGAESSADAPEIVGGRVYWQAYRICSDCAGGVEASPVRSFVVQPRAPEVKLQGPCDPLRMDLEIVGRPKETREFELGRFEVFEAAGQTFGRATYEPGWRCSEHVGRHPPGHDSWVVGDECYVSLHVLGAGEYART